MLRRLILSVWLGFLSVSLAFGQSAAERQLAADIRMLEQRIDRIAGVISKLAEAVEASGQPLAWGAFVEYYAITPGLFGAVQRRVCGVQDQLGRGMSLRSLRDADADADVDPRSMRRLRRSSRLPWGPIGTAQNKPGVSERSAKRLRERLRFPR